MLHVLARLRCLADCYFWRDPAWNRLGRQIEAAEHRRRDTARAAGMHHISELVDDESDRLWPDEAAPSR